MIDFYTWSTPNGRKVSIALEELALPYRIHAVDITAGDQHRPEFLAISPNNKTPAIVDRETGVSLMESAAILMYLADKSGRLIPTPAVARWSAIQWLVMQAANVGPIFGQATEHTYFAAGQAPYQRRMDEEVARICRVLDRRLGEAAYLAGDYSIADIANFPWLARMVAFGLPLSPWPHLARWYGAVAARSAVRRGYALLDTPDPIPAP